MNILELKTKKVRRYTLFLIICVWMNCQKKEEIKLSSSDYFAAVDKITEVMVHDIFSPPVASRIYVYPNIAAYEILAQENKELTSLSNKISHLKPIPKKDNQNIDLALAALMANLEVSKSLLFSEDKIKTYRDSLYTIWKQRNATVFQASKKYANAVSEHVKMWYEKDNYNQTRTLPKFAIRTADPARWQPTPPAYMDGIEPHWNRIRPMLLDSANQFKPIPPPRFSLEPYSLFGKELKEVYKIGNDLKQKGDDAEEVAIAKFWDCNPYVSVNRGHFMFATKKITPGAHWIGIAKIASQESNDNFAQTVKSQTFTSIAIFDAFISCWDEKYRSNLIRPETLINQHLDENWQPILQTPPFPEYTSGHSVVSGAASTMLTYLYGDNFSFEDTTEIPYGLPMRVFTSFRKAAQEAAISRLYGGIHYRAAIDEGLTQGINVGNWTVQKLKE